MLFMVKVTHDYSTCQAHHPTKADLYKNTLANLGDHGIKVHGQYSNRLIHTNFIICETDSFEALDAPLIRSLRWVNLRLPCYDTGLTGPVTSS